MEALELMSLEMTIPRGMRTPPLFQTGLPHIPQLPMAFASKLQIGLPHMVHLPTALPSMTGSMAGLMAQCSGSPLSSRMLPWSDPQSLHRQEGS